MTNVKTNKKETIKMANVYVPNDELNPFEEVVTVTINGYPYNIARGVSVDVPLEVAEILKETKYINDFRIL